MKYTDEEVRAIAKRLHDDITVADGDALMASDMLTAYAERIKADEGAVPTFSRSDVSKWRGDAFENAAQIVDRYAEHFPEVTGAADDIRALIAHPPAQAAQLSKYLEFIRGVMDVAGAFIDAETRHRVAAFIRELESVPPTTEPAQAVQVEESPMFAVSRSVHSYYTRDPEEARQAAFDGAQVREIIMGAPAAQPVAQGEVCKICGKDTPHHHLRGTAPTPAPPINLAAVREVIESHINEAKKLRHDPESQDYLYEQADKLEAAIKGGA